MSTTLPALTPLEDSLYLTLCCRALDNRSPHPLLGDALADEIVRELDYDVGQLHIDANLVNTCAPRAKRLDEVAVPGRGRSSCTTGSRVRRWSAPAQDGGPTRGT
ncbi:hypothetical protein [Modestobacter altitudinis]|uniref:hypothetical protein n=1 Tax=Modestobacter altitudinis TaxID=2213158 RepID=UPI00110C97B2|nr:hypothetical protein [Modestobacter altitudinis]